jgi:hypothetical protein
LKSKADNSLKIPSSFRLALGFLMFIAPTALCPAQDPVANPSALCSLPNLKDAVRVDGYIFRTYKSGDSNYCFQVLRDGKILFRRTNDNDGWFKLGQPEDKKWKVPAIPNGTDITGRGHPDMIVSFTSGGVHCCLSHFVFELEPKFKLLATLDAEDTWPAYFADLDHNGHYYYIAEDWTFADWWMSFAGSPYHSIVLHYVDDSKGGGFHLAIDKMQTPSPTSDEWQKALSDVQNELQLDRENMFNDIADVLWQKVINLIYTGHSDLAWKFLDEVGPKAQQKHYPNLATFCSTLKTSPYWPDLAPTLKDTPPACANAKPGH